MRVQRERNERMLITQTSIRVVILQREWDSVNKSGDTAERAMRWRTYQ